MRVGDERKRLDGVRRGCPTDWLAGWLVSNAKYLSAECAVKHVNFRQFEFIKLFVSPCSKFYFHDDLHDLCSTTSSTHGSQGFMVHSSFCHRWMPPRSSNVWWSFCTIFYGFTCRFVAAKCATRNVFCPARTARCLRAVSFNCATKDDALKVCAAFNLALKSMPHKHVICVSCTLCRVRDVLATARACVYRWVCVYGCASTRRRK